MLMQKGLESRGFAVTAANDSWSAIEQLTTAAAGFDIIVSDIVMPGRSGLSLVDLMKSLVNPIPVILVTGFPLSAEEKAIKGVFAVLAKPIDMLGLCRAIEKALA